jgi:aryl-alcohol dehydrogenase-like predicted oxidoreductase
MLRRPFGRTGLEVPSLGFGAMQAGSPQFDEARAAALLNRVVDLGLTLIDTARSYGLSEERIGRHLAHRRGEFLLSTKVGYGVPGIPDWTGPCIVAGVEAACRRLGTDVIDIVHLHSCPLETLRTGEVIEALQRCAAQGKLRVAAYSGDGPALDYAVASGAFGSVQASVNLCDQGCFATLAEARARGLGVIAKRPFACRPWMQVHTPEDPVTREYRRRFELLRARLEVSGMDWNALSLRFVAHAPEVDCCLVGSTSSQHVERNLRIIEAGPLPSAEARSLRDTFTQVGSGWTGQV